MLLWATWITSLGYVYLWDLNYRGLFSVKTCRASRSWRLILSSRRNMRSIDRKKSCRDVSVSLAKQRVSIPTWGSIASFKSSCFLQGNVKVAIIISAFTLCLCSEGSLRRPSRWEWLGVFRVQLRWQWSGQLASLTFLLLPLLINEVLVYITVCVCDFLTFRSWTLVLRGIFIGLCRCWRRRTQRSMREMLSSTQKVIVGYWH